MKKSIVITSRKGGSGKSTISYIIYKTLEERGIKTKYLVEDSWQKTVEKKHTLSGNFDYSVSDLTIKDNREKFDFHNDNLTNADIVIVPIELNSFCIDVELKALKTLKKQGVNIKVIINNFQKEPYQVNKHFEYLNKELGEENIQVLKNGLPNRDEFANIMGKDLLISLNREDHELVGGIVDEVISYLGC